MSRLLLLIVPNSSKASDEQEYLCTSSQDFIPLTNDGSSILAAAGLHFLWLSDKLHLQAATPGPFFQFIIPNLLAAGAVACAGHISVSESEFYQD